MQNSLYTACDFCAKVLAGKQGTADKHEDYISLRGSVCFTAWDKESENYKYIYAQEKNSMDFLHFCIDKSCLMDFLKARKVIFNQKSIW